MQAKVSDLMVSNVIVADTGDTVAHVRDLMATNRINAIPIADEDGTPRGIVSTSDLATKLDPDTPISELMTEKVYTVAQYDGPHVAARVMRNHKIHHAVVTHEQKIVGILSSFDLLRLVEDHRFVMKNAPTKSKKGGGRQ